MANSGEARIGGGRTRVTPVSVTVAQRIRALSRAIVLLPDLTGFLGAAWEQGSSVACLTRLAALKRELARLQGEIDEIAAQVTNERSGGEAWEKHREAAFMFAAGDVQRWSAAHDGRLPTFRELQDEPFRFTREFARAFWTHALAQGWIVGEQKGDMEDSH